MKYYIRIDLEFDLDQESGYPGSKLMEDIVQRVKNELEFDCKVMAYRDTIHNPLYLNNLQIKKD